MSTLISTLRPFVFGAAVVAVAVALTLGAAPAAHASHQGYLNCLHGNEPAYGTPETNPLPPGLPPTDYPLDQWCCVKSGGFWSYHYTGGPGNQGGYWCGGWRQEWLPEDGATAAPLPPGATNVN